MRKLVILLALLLPATLLRAENLRVAHIFSDHMVLQRETFVPIWGWGEPGKTVTVEPSWCEGRTVSAKVAKDGPWCLNIETTEAGGTVIGFDGNAPALMAPSMVIAANTETSCQRILATVRKYLTKLPY